MTLTPRTLAALLHAWLRRLSDIGQPRPAGRHSVDTVDPTLAVYCLPATLAERIPPAPTQTPEVYVGVPAPQNWYCRTDEFPVLTLDGPLVELCDAPAVGGYLGAPGELVTA